MTLIVIYNRLKRVTMVTLNGSLLSCTINPIPIRFLYKCSRFQFAWFVNHTGWWAFLPARHSSSLFILHCSTRKVGDSRSNPEGSFSRGHFIALVLITSALICETHFPVFFLNLPDLPCCIIQCSKKSKNLARWSTASLIAHLWLPIS